MFPVRTTIEAGAGAGGGAYCESVYTFGLTSGYPAAGSSLAWAVGAPGAGADAGGVTGTYGQVVFSWTDPPTPTVSSISHPPVRWPGVNLLLSADKFHWSNQRHHRWQRGNQRFGGQRFHDYL